MWLLWRELKQEVRTKGESIDEPSERFHAECKVFTDSFSKGNVGVIIADVDPIPNIYDESARPAGDIRALATKLMVEDLPSHMYNIIIRYIQ